VGALSFLPHFKLLCTQPPPFRHEIESALHDTLHQTTNLASALSSNECALSVCKSGYDYLSIVKPQNVPDEDIATAKTAVVTYEAEILYGAVIGTLRNVPSG
jgi:hypothetical protein